MKRLFSVAVVLAVAGFGSAAFADDEAKPAGAPEEGAAVAQEAQAAENAEAAEKPAKEAEAAAGGEASSPGEVAEAPKPAESKPDMAKVSYAIGADFGANIGQSLKRQGITLDAEQFAKGVKDALTGQMTMSAEETRAVLEAFRKEMVSTQQQRMAAMAERNKEEGEAFLAENKTKEGVVTLPNGLQYKVLKEGDGAMPKATDTVSVNYTGTLIDGTVFDASARHGGPATFRLNGVIRGWTEALQLMKVGSKWMLYIPSDLAYGPGPGGPGGPNSTLIFEVELLGIEPAPSPIEPDATP